MALLVRTPHRPEIPPKHEPFEDGDDDAAADVCSDTPIRLVPLLHLYSATSPCVSASRSSNVMSKKVKARKLASFFDRHNLDPKKPALTVRKPPIVNVYSRRGKRARGSTGYLSVFEMLIARNSTSIKIEQAEECDELESGAGSEKKKRRRIGSSELVKLGVDSSVLCIMSGPRLRESRKNNGVSPSKKPNSACTKRWVRLSCSGVDPNAFIGLQCRVYWPLDDDWYAGHVTGYNPETNRHSVEYADGDEEKLMLSNEKIKFYVSREDMQCLNLTIGIKSMESDGLEFSEMAVLAASLDCQELEPGDVIWAKLAGHATWPAIIADCSRIDKCKGLNGVSGGKSIPVQFFGSHDFARIKPKQVISFLEGLLSSLHLKCKKPCFVQSLEEAKVYLNEQKLPKRMMQIQTGIYDDDPDGKKGEDGATADSGDDCMVDEGEPRTIKTPPFQIGDLQVLCLGDVVKDSDCFKDDKFIWPEGYTAVRKFTSITDPSVSTLYKMEVLRDGESKMLPVFKVTLDGGEQFKGSTPSACWNKIYKRIRKVRNSSSDGSDSESGARIIYKSGSDMFGFSDPRIFKLIQELSNPKLTSRYSTGKLSSRRYNDLPVGYRPVRVDWKDLDKCSVCHMDEEYENNLFLQCDSCRMMVHARCYGELEPVDGVLWLCNLCRSEAPESPPPCCLCPVIGGAMKPTTDGRWAHLACAIWIPETCLSDVKRMEPIDGINRVSKDRWKLLCSICGVSYGACIQCSNITCRVAYHPLCARAAGLCVELEDEDRLHLISYDEDEEDQCIRFLSFCKKHRQPSNERPAAEDRTCQNSRECSNYTPPSNPSGCARSEPYNYFGRRGRKEPEALAAASLKRLFVENRPYLVNGNCRHESFGNTSSSSAHLGSKFSLDVQKLKTIEIDAPKNIVSMAEKYTYMKETFKKRLAFGKSRIHGFGIFTKHPHRAGDMMIEYTGELVRPSIADRREHFIYNSLVGAGTYMFRIDDERVIDATRFGSIAHLINHSCEPNCYSRVISVNGDEHIIIFAKRDIKRWEELSYDYRFFSIDEQLACYCGFPGCRSIVNDIDSEEQAAKLHVPFRELIDWRGE